MARMKSRVSIELGVQPSRVDSDDGPFLKRFPRCFESIQRTCRIDSYVDRNVLKGTRESIRGFQNRFTSVQDLNSTFENCLKVDSSSSESILKEEECHRVDITLFSYRFELGKLVKHSSGVFGLASPQIESSVVFCRRISEVCPEYVLGIRTLCNELGLRRFQFGVILEEQKKRNLEHSARAPTPRRGHSHLGVQSHFSGPNHPRLGVDINA
ncbi:hypothetical protein PIB30_087655 [Stylosanthes scabra]|uniref:Uncharacterized protein n=1 Tax=Stylosanthes scabra TaxID=79078 RepID=A0ABU6VVF8_9FABA|nr:hypothetical protein [Stylosanthes scabra]